VDVEALAVVVTAEVVVETAVVAVEETADVAVAVVGTRVTRMSGSP